MDVLLFGLLCCLGCIVVVMLFVGVTAVLIVLYFSAWLLLLIVCGVVRFSLRV